jgi:hypothetical protein
MVVPSQPWQGAPAARAPLHPLRQTGLSESPSACPDACDAGRATLAEIVEAGATNGRCITSQAERSSSPDTPMTEGRLRSPLDPIAQPSAGWMPPILGDQSFRALNHDKGSIRAPFDPIEHGQACPLHPCIIKSC